MTTLFIVFLLALLFAYLTERTTVGEYGKGQKQSARNRFFYILLLLTLILPIGLRRIYNDTGTYIDHFLAAPTLETLFSSGKLHILQNPAFNIYTSLVRQFTDNYSIYFLIAAAFVCISFAGFIRRHVKSYVLGIGLLFCLGTYVFSIAAMKQSIAMAILLYALEQLIHKKYIRYFLIVFIAFLFHTYAIAFLILPLFVGKPWNWRTTLLMLGLLFVMWNFESVIGSFLEFAGDNGKPIGETVIFGTPEVNIFRVLVYAVLPLIALLFRNFLLRDEQEGPYGLFVNMAIISFSIMSLGTVCGANMFARMAMYFDFGIICSLPWLIQKAFVEKTAKGITIIASACFLGFFMYANIIAMPFDYYYRAVSLWDFLGSLF